MVNNYRINPLIAVSLVLLAAFVGYVISHYPIILSLLFIVVPYVGFFFLLLLNKPKIALYLLVAYCFGFVILSREIGGPIPYGTLIEGLLLAGWLSVLLRSKKGEWQAIANDLCLLFLLWFLISVVQVANPSGASVQGWLQEIRSAALYPLLIVSLAFMVFRKNSDLNGFLMLIIGFSVLAALNGIKQLHIGLSPGEQLFLNQGGAVTHVLWGRLRVFSFYSDAGQFGASQAHIGMVALCLAFGPFKWWKRALLFAAAGLLFYGMLISGTRGALFALVVGAFLAVVLSKQFKILTVGGGLLLAFILFLKFTHIGDGNYQIYRFRSALNPDDPSLNVRLATQNLLRDYLADKPFGEGLGVIGAFGNTYNSDMFISTVQPDSYFVKIWAMYGVVGLTIWLSIMAYILGKCCGIVWRITDKALRIKLIALTAGFGGILVCSYGNEVINTMPSSIIVYVSWVLIFQAPKLEDELLGRVREHN